MASNNPFQGSSNITVEKDKVIRITKRTVTFGNSVYQTRNISGFGDGEIKLGSILPFPILLAGFLIGLILANFPGTKLIGFILLIGSIGILVYQVSREKQYGLLLTLNSGDKYLFTTTDKKGLGNVVGTLCEFIEKDAEGVYTVTVHDNSINVQGSVTGTVVTGKNPGNISTNIKF